LAYEDSNYNNNVFMIGILYTNPPKHLIEIIQKT